LKNTRPQHLVTGEAVHR